jgi:predicted alpha-1,6-mannanase (GH76 family)
VIVEKLGTNGDASLFKGVMVRYLDQLRDVLRERKQHPDAAEAMDRCIRRSVVSMLQHSVGGSEGLYTAEWHEEGKDRTANFNSQTSALAALVAALPPKGKD